MGLKTKIKNNKIIVSLISFERKIFGINKIKGRKGNTLKIEGLMKGTRVNINGKGNQIVIKKPRTNDGLNLFMNGNKNVVRMEENCVLKNLSVWIEDDNNEIFIGKNTLICGDTKLSCIEGCKIRIGENCMFSSGIEIRTGDSHSILDGEGKRINPSKDVIISNHVWIGEGVTVLKGVTIEEDSIVGTKSVVTKPILQKGVIIAGSPAKVVKEGVGWSYKRVAVGETVDD